MKILLYFAMTKYNDIVYLDEKPITTITNNQSRLIDLIDDYLSLNSELNWDKLDKEHKPTNIGCYQAVVEYKQTAEDDYELNVISCTPTFVLFEQNSGKE